MKQSSMFFPSLLAVGALALVVSAFRLPQGAPNTVESPGLISTIYASDPLQYTLNLRTGQDGIALYEGELRNRGSQITLGYYPDCLTVGIQGGETGAIVDLGTLPEAAKLLGLQFVGNSGNAYVSLAPAWVREHAGMKETVKQAHAPVRVGHLYIVRLSDPRDGDVYAKFVVLEYQPGVKVTLRWQQLAG